MRPLRKASTSARVRKSAARRVSHQNAGWSGSLTISPYVVSQESDLCKHRKDGTSRTWRVGRAIGLVEGTHERMDIEQAVLDKRRENHYNRTTQVFWRQCQQVLRRWKKGKKRRRGHGASLEIVQPLTIVAAANFRKRLVAMIAALASSSAAIRAGIASERRSSL